MGQHGHEHRCRWQRCYNAYGRYRSGGTLPTDRRYTGQQRDDTGLYYYNARYYDPQIGTFLSPDTLVPDPGNVQAYNRYLYALGNPVKLADSTGHFSEDQLTEWYGESWRSLFTDDWIKLLLDSPGSQIAGAQLGDLVVMGNGDNLIQGVLVTGAEGGLALWDVNNKTPIDVAAMGSGSYDTLALYRIAGGETGSASPRYEYLWGGTQYLSGVNGNGTGPYAMKLLGEYSTNPQSSSVALPGDWFTGRNGQGYYVHNAMTFQGLNFGSPASVLGSIGTSLSAADLANTIPRGLTPSRLSGWSTGLSISTMIYGSMMYRPTYTLASCAGSFVNYCGSH